MVLEELDRLKSQFAGCETLAFADLSTKMILVTNSDANLPREALDKLCAEATVVLGKSGKPSLGDTDAETAYVSSGGQLRVFMRAPDEPDDVLCCICASSIDIAGFLADARPSLAQISGGG